MYYNKEEFNLGNYIQDKEEPIENELLDYSTLFLETIKKLSGKKGFGAIIWIVGTTGSGKSTLMCELDDILLKYSFPKRNVAFYQAPENLLKEVKKAVPSTLRNKFRIIDKLTEVNKFDILNVDEGILSADAKNALTKDSVNFIGSLTTLRHNSVIIILNSLDNGILRGYRLKAQFRFYKLLTEGYMDEVNDKFAKRHRDNITNLFPEQTIFSISHIDFLKAKLRKGVLTLPMKKYCTWYNEKISRSFEGEDFDARMRRLVKKKLDIEDVILLLIRKFGGNLTIKLARGFLFDKYIETFRVFESDMKNIVEVAQFRMFESRQEQEQEVQEEIIEQLSVNTRYYNISLEFADYVRDKLEIESESIIGYELCRGKTYEQIVHDNPEFTMYNVKKIAKKLKMKADGKSRLCYLFEDWHALRILNVPEDQLTKAVSHGRLRPDNIWNGEIYSLKFSLKDKLKTFSYSISADLNPEFKMAVKNSTTFRLVYFNPTWLKRYQIGFLTSEPINPNMNIVRVVVKPTGIIIQSNSNSNTSNKVEV